jgi:hypothetical protein
MGAALSIVLSGCAKEKLNVFLLSNLYSEEVVQTVVSEDASPHEKIKNDLK